LGLRRTASARALKGTPKRAPKGTPKRTPKGKKTGCGTVHCKTHCGTSLQDALQNLRTPSGATPLPKRTSPPTAIEVRPIQGWSIQDQPIEDQPIEDKRTKEEPTKKSPADERRTANVQPAHAGFPAGPQGLAREKCMSVRMQPRHTARTGKTLAKEPRPTRLVCDTHAARGLVRHREPQKPERNDMAMDDGRTAPAHPDTGDWRGADKDGTEPSGTTPYTGASFYCRSTCVWAEKAKAGEECRGTRKLPGEFTRWVPVFGRL
jgi:hypothetical protein